MNDRDRSMQLGSLIISCFIATLCTTPNAIKCKSWMTHWGVTPKTAQKMTCINLLIVNWTGTAAKSWTISGTSKKFHYRRRTSQCLFLQLSQLRILIYYYYTCGWMMVTLIFRMRLRAICLEYIFNFVDIYFLYFGIRCTNGDSSAHINFRLYRHHLLGVHRCRCPTRERPTTTTTILAITSTQRA